MKNWKNHFNIFLDKVKNSSLSKVNLDGRERLHFNIRQQIEKSSALVVLDEDKNSHQLLVGMSHEHANAMNCLVSIEDKKLIKIDSSVLFDSSLNNLKTFSTVVNLAMGHGCMASGLIPHNNKKLKIFFACTASSENIITQVNRMKDCILLISSYLNARARQSQLLNLDLSMFSGIDLSYFNPQILGEKKEFVYQSWQEFMIDVAEQASENDSDVTSMISELHACSEFEKKNDMLLCEIGDQVLDELYWNQKMLDQNGEDFQVN